MDVDGTPAGIARVPSTGDVVALVVIAPLAGLAVRAGAGPPLIGTPAFVALAEIGVVVGLPALYWVLGRGATRLGTFVALGAAAGCVLPAVILASGLVGLLARGGAPSLRWTLIYGAPLPGIGITPWWTFMAAELQAAVVGAATAAIYWGVFVRPHRPGPAPPLPEP